METRLMRAKREKEEKKLQKSVKRHSEEVESDDSIVSTESKAAKVTKVAKAVVSDSESESSDSDSHCRPVKRTKISKPPTKKFAAAVVVKSQPPPQRRLYEHQERAKSLMNQMEANFVDSANSSTSSRSFGAEGGTGQKINVGVLGNDTGTGKTITVLSLIFDSPRVVLTDGDYVALLEECTPLPTDLCKLVDSYMHKPSDWDLTHRNNVGKNERLFYCGTVEPPSEELSKSKTILPLNIVVSPHGLMSDPWLNELKKTFPTKVPLVYGGPRSVELTVDWLKGQIASKGTKTSRLSVLCSSKNAYARSVATDTVSAGGATDTGSRGSAATLLLCNSNKYPELAKFLNQNRIKVQRVIYDEATGNHLPACLSIDAYYYWAMSATWTELVGIRNKGFLKDRFATLSLRQIKSILVRIDASTGSGDTNSAIPLNFKPYLNHVISCKAEPVQQIINSCYPHSRLADFVNEGLFDHCRTYLRKRVASNKSSPWIKYCDAESGIIEDSKGGATKPYLSTYSILELQLLNIGLNGTLATATCLHRVKLLFEKIFNARICLRCSAPLSSDIATTSEAAGYRTACCGINYCTNCATDGESTTFHCPLCVRDYKKVVKFLPNVTNGERQLSGVDMLAECERLIQYYGGHWVYLDSTSENKKTDSALFGKQKTRKKSVALLRREAMREAQTELEGRALTSVSRECKFIGSDELSKPQAALKIIEHYSELLSRGASDRPTIILLFVNSTKTSMLLAKMFKAAAVQYKHLNGAGSRISKLVTGVVRATGTKSSIDAKKPLVLLISSENGTDRGVNIPLADVQIIYDAKDKQTTIQKVARTQRHGRSPDADPLHVYELRYSKMSTSY